MCFGVSNPLTNIAPSFLPSPHLNMQTIQAPFPTGTPRQIDVNLTFILRRSVEDQISTNFHVISAYFFDGNFADRKIHVVSKFFWYNFADQKIHVVSTNFFRCNFSSRDTHGASTYSFWHNFDGPKIHFVCTYFFRQNFDGQKFDVVFGKL